MDKQCLQLKALKFGIKTHKLCESTTEYLWSFVVYTNSTIKLESSLITPNTKKTTAIVLHLVEPLLNKGRTVWMGSFYNFPELAAMLKDKGIDCVGILKLNRRGVSKSIR